MTLKITRTDQSDDLSDIKCKRAFIAYFYDQKVHFIWLFSQLKLVVFLFEVGLVYAVGIVNQFVVASFILSLITIPIMISLFIFFFPS